VAQNYLFQVDSKSDNTKKSFIRYGLAAGPAD